MGLDFFKLEELTPSSSSAFSSSSTESDMSYGQSLLQPGECIITKETPKVDGVDFFPLPSGLALGISCGSHAK